MINSADPSHTHKVFLWACLVSWDSFFVDQGIHDRIEAHQPWWKSRHFKGLALGDGITRWRTGKRQRVGNDKVPMWNSKWAGLTKCGKHISFSSCSFMMFDATWCNFFLKVCDLRLGCFSTTVLLYWVILRTVSGQMAGTVAIHY